jgi:hypothetical protein
MNQHDHHGHERHAQQHHAGRKTKSFHKDWRTWLVVGLMLAAMLAYVLSDDEALAPGPEEGERMPAAGGP